MPSILLNPTGKGIRIDSAGDGRYGSPRSSGTTKRIHRGTDLLCDPGQEIVAPDSGMVVRKAYPYSYDTKWEGVLISCEWCEIIMFYFIPNVAPNTMISRGQSIGIAQDISKKYPNSGMKPHIHLELREISKDPYIYLDI